MSNSKEKRLIKIELEEIWGFNDLSESKKEEVSNLILKIMKLDKISLEELLPIIENKRFS